MVLASPAEMIPIVAIVGGLSIGALCVILGTINSMHKTKVQEQSRREIAAYIAEGSMTPEQGEKLMASNPKNA